MRWRTKNDKYEVYSWFVLSRWLCAKQRRGKMDPIFVANLRTFLAYNLQAKNCCGVQKMTNIRYGQTMYLICTAIVGHDVNKPVWRKELCRSHVVGNPLKPLGEVSNHPVDGKIYIDRIDVSVFEGILVQFYKYWIWIQNTNTEYRIQILNLKTEFERFV